jgi:hypothetical protein
MEVHHLLDLHLLRMVEVLGQGLVLMSLWQLEHLVVLVVEDLDMAEDDQEELDRNKLEQAPMLQ